MNHWPRYCDEYFSPFDFSGLRIGNGFPHTKKVYSSTATTCTYDTRQLLRTTETGSDVTKFWYDSEDQRIIKENIEYH